MLEASNISMKVSPNKKSENHAQKTIVIMVTYHKMQNGEFLKTYVTLKSCLF